MKKFCDKMNYEFIIFDKNTKKSYIEENGNLINFEFIDETIDIISFYFSKIQMVNFVLRAKIGILYVIQILLKISINVNLIILQAALLIRQMMIIIKE